MLVFLSECWLMAGLYRASHDFNCDLQYVLTFKRGQVVEVRAKPYRLLPLPPSFGV